MKKRRGIYIFTDASNGLKYIGKSLDISKRVREHYSNKEKSRFQNALVLRPEKFSLEIIELPLASNAELNALEICYIKVLDTLSPNGYNLKAGGNSGEMSKETKQRMSEVKSLPFLSAHTLRRRSDSLKKYHAEKAAKEGRTIKGTKAKQKKGVLSPMVIDRERFYWDCYKKGLGKIADKLGLSASGFQRKLKCPTKKLYVDELFAICKILQPEKPELETIQHYTQ